MAPGDNYDLYVYEANVQKWVGISRASGNADEEIVLTCDASKSYYVAVYPTTYGASTHGAVLRCDRVELLVPITLAEDDAYLSDLISESGATRSGNSLSLVVEGVSRTWNNFGVRWVNGREVISITDFTNVLVPASVINSRFIAMNNLNNGGAIMVAGIEVGDISALRLEGTNVYQNKGVKKAQKALKDTNCWIDANGNPSSADITGHFGSTTRASLIKYQQDVMQLDLQYMFEPGYVPTSRSNIYSDEVLKHYNGLDERMVRALSGERLGAPSITLVTPVYINISNSTATISANGTNCDHIAAVVNGVCVAIRNGNNFNYTFPISSNATYSVCVCCWK
jgi:hypothetical protein